MENKLNKSEIIIAINDIQHNYLQFKSMKDKNSFGAAMDPELVDAFELLHASLLEIKGEEVYATLSKGVKTRVDLLEKSLLNFTSRRYANTFDTAPSIVKPYESFRSQKN